MYTLIHTKTFSVLVTDCTQLMVNMVPRFDKATKHFCSARTLLEVDRTEHGRRPVEGDRLIVDLHVLDASDKGRRDGERLLLQRLCRKQGSGGELVKAHVILVSLNLCRTEVLFITLQETYLGLYKKEPWIKYLYFLVSLWFSSSY